MADIARLAGVSVSTVSRALSDSALVSAETRARISELARSLNYAINVGAQNLRLKQSRTVAVVVPYESSSQQRLSDPFFLSLIGSIADALTLRGFDMLLSRIDAEHLVQCAQHYDSGRAVGTILIGQWRHAEQLNELAARRVPLVVWGAQTQRQLYCTVGGDNVQGGRLATEHLLASGARQVAFLGDIELPEVGQRHEGYLQAHQARGLAVDPALCRRVPFVPEAIQADLDALIKSGKPFDALVASSDVVAMTAIGMLRRAGLRVPEDVSVVGYDDIALAAHFHPPLTTVRQPVDQAGELLVEALLSQLDGARPESRQLATELVHRESAGPVHARPARSRRRAG